MIENFVIIPNRLLYAYDKNNSFKVYLLMLLQLNMSIRGKCIFNVKWLLDKMNIKLNDSRRVKQIHNCLLELKSEDLLLFDVELNKINNTDMLFVEINCENNYVQITDSEFETIHSYSDQNVNIKDLLSLFAYIKSRIDDKGYCYPSIKLIADDLGLNTDTVTKYNDILCNKLKLILIENVGSRVFQDGSVKVANNLYAINNENGRKKLDNRVKQYKYEMEEKDIKIVRDKLRKEKQSVKMKLYHLERKYNEGKICDVEFGVGYYELTEEYNKLVKASEDLENSIHIK